MPMQIEKLFPSLIAKGQFKGHSTLNNGLLREIREFSAQDKMGQDWSKKNYRGGYTSYASLDDMHHRARAFSQFESSMEPHAKLFARKQGWNIKGLNLVMTHCWMNIMPSGTYHTLHLHPHSVISGAYYVETPKGSVSLKIEDPRMSFYMNSPLRTEGPGLYHEIKAKAGTYVMFESWLRHEVPPNQSKTPRISISFNYSIEDLET